MLGILPDDDFQLELAKLDRNQVSNSSKIETMKIGRGAVDEISPAVRALISESALEGASNKSVAEAFQVSKSSVSAYKHGATSTASYNEPDKQLKTVVDNKKKSISDAAHNNIIAALRAITPDKLSEAGLKTASSVARDMSVIIKNMEPDAPAKSDSVQIVIYAPPIKSEEDYNKPILVVDE